MASETINARLNIEKPSCCRRMMYAARMSHSRTSGSASLLRLSFDSLSPFVAVAWRASVGEVLSCMVRDSRIGSGSLLDMLEVMRFVEAAKGERCLLEMPEVIRCVLL